MTAIGIHAVIPWPGSMTQVAGASHVRGRTFRSRVGLLGLFAAVLLANPGAAAAVQPQGISIEAHTQRGCPTASSCVFVASGAINDAGSTLTDSLKATALPSPVVGTAQYVKTFHGQAGSLTIQLESMIRPTDVPWLWHEEGHWVVVSGTGAYAGLTGQGSEVGTRNYATNSLDVVYTGQLH